MTPVPPGIRYLTAEDRTTLDAVEKARSKDLQEALDEGYRRGRKEGYDTGYEEGRAAGLKTVAEPAAGLPSWRTMVMVLSLLTILPFLLGLFLGLFLFKLVA